MRLHFSSQSFRSSSFSSSSSASICATILLLPQLQVQVKRRPAILATSNSSSSSCSFSFIVRFPRSSSTSITSTTTTSSTTTPTPVVHSFTSPSPPLTRKRILGWLFAGSEGRLGLSAKHQHQYRRGARPGPGQGPGRGRRQPPRKQFPLWILRWRRFFSLAEGNSCGQRWCLPPVNMEVVKGVLRVDESELDKLAVTTLENGYSYADLLRSACALSTVLEKELGGVDSAETGKENGFHQANGHGANGHGANGHEAKPNHKNDGPRIGIMAKPSAEFVASMWAAWLNGYIAVPIALSYPEAEIHHVMTDADISMVLATEEYKGLFEKVVKQCPAKLYITPPVGGDEKNSPSLDKLLAEVKTRSEKFSGDAGALIIYTSGTTGRPKGVVHTQAGLGSQVKMLAESWGYTSSDRFLHVLPLHHVHGLINSLLAPLYAGARVDFLPKFSVSGVWQNFKKSYPVNGEAEKNPITAFTGVPTVYVRLLQGYDNMDAETQKASTYAASQLRLMMCGSSALPQPIMERWESLTGHRLLERYGMTEFGMGVTNPLKGERKAGYVGQPFPGITIKVGEGETAEAGVGELLLKSPSMFREYWRQPKVTADNFTEDGYFKTGDTVTIDDGYVKILGRTSVDILKVGGYKLSALEIEAVLLEHPSIAECAVLGLPDKDYGEFMCAVIVPPETSKTGQTVLTSAELTKWAKGKMAPYKIPQQLLVWDNMPRNAMGKVNKKELKKEILEPKQ